MKKLAARDFEDLLQVQVMFFVSSYVLNFGASAPFQPSRVYSKKNTTKLFRNFSSSWQLGMAWQNFGYILNQP
jgi:hypothetical protein